MHTITRHYQQLCEKLELSVKNLTTTIFLLEARTRRPPLPGAQEASHTLPDGSSVTGYQLDDGSIVDKDGNELVDASGTVAQGTQIANPVPTPTNPAVAPTNPAVAPTNTTASLGAPITPSTVLSSSISPTSSTPKTAYTVRSGLDIDYGRYSVKNDPRRDAALTRIGVGEVGKALMDARLQANLEMKDIEAKRRSSGLTPEETSRLDSLKTRWTSGYKGQEERRREGEFNTRQREREERKQREQKQREENERIRREQEEAKKNTAPSLVRNPKGEVSPFVAAGEPGSPGVAPLPTQPDGSNPLPAPPTQTTPPTPFYPTPTGEAPTTGGQVNARAQSMSGTTPVQTSPSSAPIAKPGPGGMSTQPVGPMARPLPQPVQTTGMSITPPSKPATPEPSASLSTPASNKPKTAIAASINSEQQGPGPAEKDRAIPSPSENPYENRQRGRVVTRAAATMSPRVRSSIRFA